MDARFEISSDLLQRNLLAPEASSFEYTWYVLPRSNDKHGPTVKTCFEESLQKADCGDLSKIVASSTGYSKTRPDNNGCWNPDPRLHFLKDESMRNLANEHTDFEVNLMHLEVGTFEHPYPAPKMESSRL